MISRITGFVRTWAMAFALGSTLLASSYTVANNLPNMLYELVAVSYTHLFASAVIAAVPAVLVFALGREYLERGIAATARKDRS